MADLISRDFIKSLGGECIAARDSKTDELLPIISIDALPPAQPEIIRCENCKHCEMTDNYNYCKVWRRETSIDGYCYKGDAND